jgi:hypothetical protein
VPDHGEHTVLYYGRASNRARGERKKARTEPSETQDPPVAAASTLPDTRKSFRLAWSALLKRVWNIDASRCPRCHGDLRILSAIQKADVILRILDHLGLSDQPRAPDPHDCEDRDPDAAARHPLLHPDGEDPGTHWPVADPDGDWPMDPPHPED